MLFPSHLPKPVILTCHLDQMRHALIRFLAALDVDAAWYVPSKEKIVNSFVPLFPRFTRATSTTCPVFYLVSTPLFFSAPNFPPFVLTNMIVA
jgi:hypothetical protein